MSAIDPVPAWLDRSLFPSESRFVDVDGNGGVLNAASRRLIGVIRLRCPNPCARRTPGVPTWIEPFGIGSCWVQKNRF